MLFSENLDAEIYEFHLSFSSKVFFFPSSVDHTHRPWFLLHGIHNISSKNNQTFAFDPVSNRWLLLPNFPNQQEQQQPNTSSIGTDGFFFISAPKFCYTRILNPIWRATASLNFPRINPLLGVFNDGSDSPKFIVVGGVRLIGNLVDIEDNLPVEIYHPNLDCWILGPPLPADLSSGNSSSTLSSALFRGRFYVFGIYSCFVSSFDLNERVWSEVQTLRPPGIAFSFLIACRKQLVLAGICNTHHEPSFNLWKVDEKMMEFSEIAIMPHDLLNSLCDSDEDDKFASLKCVGLGDLIYVFNEEYHRIYPTCVCEIDSESGECSWRRLPQLPLPVNKFHKVISFCSTVSLHTIFGGREHRGLIEGA